MRKSKGTPLFSNNQNQFVKSSSSSYLGSRATCSSQELLPSLFSCLNMSSSSRDGQN